MHTETPGVHVDIEKTIRDSENVAICKPRREASEDTSPANTLILDLQLSKV